MDPLDTRGTHLQFEGHYKEARRATGEKIPHENARRPNPNSRRLHWGGKEREDEQELYACAARRPGPYLAAVVSSKCPSRQKRGSFRRESNPSMCGIEPRPNNSKRITIFIREAPRRGQYQERVRPRTVRASAHSQHRREKVWGGG